MLINEHADVIIVFGSGLGAHGKKDVKEEKNLWSVMFPEGPGPGTQNGETEILRFHEQCESVGRAGDHCWRKLR